MEKYLPKFFTGQKKNAVSTMDSTRSISLCQTKQSDLQRTTYTTRWRQFDGYLVLLLTQQNQFATMLKELSPPKVYQL